MKPLLFAAIFSLSITPVFAQINAKDIYISADKTLEEIYINGVTVKLDKDASQFSSVKNLGPHDQLKSLAIKATAGIEGGLIAMINTESNGRVISDYLWKVYPSPDASKPPVDKNGREWFHPDYDDSMWGFATEDGRFGIPPWHRGEEPMKGFKSLTETMRVHTGQKVFGPYKASSLNSKWIWSGNATYPVKQVYFRRSFSNNGFNQKTPPTRPYGFKVNKVTKTKAQFSWQPSFSHLGKVSYRVYWNGLHIKTVDECNTELSNLAFSTKPNNYAYVRAIDKFGNLSKPTAFEIIKMKDTTPPEAPKDLRVVKTGSKLIELSWKPGKDETQLHNYFITIDKAAFIAPPGSTNFRYSGKMLKPNTVYNIKVFAKDLDNNKSKPAEVTAKTVEDNTPINSNESPDKTPPRIRLTGLTDRSIVIRWNRPGSNVQSGLIKLSSNNKVIKEVKVSHPLTEHIEIKGLNAGTSYSAIMEFNYSDKKKTSSNEISFTTVQLPKEKPHRVIASLTTPDTQHLNFHSALQDAKNEGCELLISFGNYGPQDKAKDNHWNKFMSAVQKVEKEMPVFMSPSSHDVQAAFLDPITTNFTNISSGKYNRYMHHTGRKLNQVIDQDNIRIIWTLSKNFGNKDGELFLQNAIHQADQKPEITHVFVLCAFQEEIADWEKILANSSKPIIVLDRYINGNPGYAITWEPGESFIQVSSQRNRTKTADYQKIHIYENTVYFEQRAQNQKTGMYETSVIHSIEYNRKKQVIKPSMIRNRHTSGMVLGSNIQVNKHPWAINQKVLIQNGKANFKLTGVCPLGKELKFTIHKKPSHGEISGGGNSWTYEPRSSFKDKDYLLFQVDNGNKSQLAWVKFAKE